MTAKRRVLSERSYPTPGSDGIELDFQGASGSVDLG